MSIITEIESNKNCNGGGLALNITGKYESNRHAIAKIEKKTFGDVCKFLKSKKGGNFDISAKQLLNIYCDVNGEPEWHHAGFLPKSYGGGMKKTYFLDDYLNVETVIKLLKKHSRNITKSVVKNYNSTICFEQLKEFELIHGKEFSRIQTKPEFAFVKKTEMSGKFGWFESQSKYSLPEYFSGVSFNTLEILNKYEYLCTHL